MESTLAGCARCLFSDTSAAAVTCASMSPEFKPGRGLKKAGSPDNAGSTNMATRRSASEPISHTASAIMSGYLGNSFVAAYAAINTFWAIFMYKKANDSEKATAQFKENMDEDVLKSLSRHYYRHKFYACANGITIFISGIGSEVSSTLWQGYVVLIPFGIGSIFCNYYWRYYCGYDRTACHYRDWP